MADAGYRKIFVTAGKLNEFTVKNTCDVDGFLKIKTGYKGDTRPPMPTDEWQIHNNTETLSGMDEHFWVYKKIKTPERTSKTERLYMNIKTGREGNWDASNPQGLVFLNGKEYQGIDINHTDFELDFNTEYDLHIYFYSGTEEYEYYFRPSYKIIDVPTQQLYFDIQMPFEGLECLSENDDNRAIIIKHLCIASTMLDLRVPYSKEYYDSIKEASDYLKNEFYLKECGKSNTEVTCIGHTHIDVAWLWRLCQTEEKAQRSFSTVLRMMEEYDDYVFMSSQPQLYKYVKENIPELYEKIKDRIKEGRWEADGAMWLEADCNLSSGESLVRQIMHGKKFFKDEFDVDSRVLWLPDVFGYSAALPQILKKSGVDKFVTSKISWNDTNKLPYDVFMWEGLDGTEIFTTFITAQDYKFDEVNNYTTYVGNITPKMVMGARKRFQQKQYSERALITFGHGDGGGGPTRTMMEYHRRLKYGLPGFPKSVVEKAGAYLEKLENDFKTAANQMKILPKWVGELYLEFHRGTYTSVAKIKKNNRTSEFLFQTAEQLSAMAEMLCGVKYPEEDIYKSWETILLNQFHDIIPGSSIEEVYNDSDIQFAQIKELGNNIVNGVYEKIAAGVKAGTVIYNPNSFEVSTTVNVDGKTAYAENIPSMGWRLAEDIKTTNEIKVDSRSIESRFYSIKLDENGNITSIYDKENDREVVCGIANQIEAFEDFPDCYDNWELQAQYKLKKWDVNDVSEITPIDDGVRAGLKIKRKFMNSEIVQEIYVYDDIRRIDFETYLDWKESHIILKAAFPINVHADKATYETQFGYLERPTHANTPYDEAKFEVCAHKYADISDDSYGAAILNDCKYGHNADGSTLKLTLLKSGTYPNKNADKEQHRFTYSLYPHAGKHTNGSVVQQAYLINRPLKAIKAHGDGSLADSFSLCACDKENVVIETFKKAESGSGYIMRAYDAYNRKENAEFSFGFNIKKAYICDMLENKLKEIEVKDNKIKVNISNFEIATILLEV